MTLSSAVFSDRLFEEMSAGIAYLDADLRALRVNDSCCEILGVERESLLGEPIDEAGKMASLVRYLRAIQQNKIDGEDGKTLVFERPGEEPRLVEVRAWSTDEDLLWVVLDDRTEMESLLAQARYSERGFREIIEYAPDGIAIHRDNRFLYINPAYVT